MKDRLFAVLIAAVWLLLQPLSQPLRGQFTTASLNGVVTDSSGAAVLGAKVSIRNTETGFQLTATTGDTGLYVFPRVPVGNYTLNAERAGFSVLSTYDSSRRSHLIWRNRTL